MFTVTSDICWNEQVFVYIWFAHLLCTQNLANEMGTKVLISRKQIVNRAQQSSRSQSQLKSSGSKSITESAVSSSGSTAASNVKCKSEGQPSNEPDREEQGEDVWFDRQSLFRVSTDIHYDFNCAFFDSASQLNSIFKPTHTHTHTFFRHVFSFLLPLPTAVLVPIRICG